MRGPNEAIAERLDEVALILEEQRANPFRVRAYRRGAATLRRLGRPVAEVLERSGLPGLEALPGVGESLARSIRELVRTGRLPMLDRLRGESDPEGLLRTVPGIGRTTAARLRHELGIETLEALEAAAHDGRLETVTGFGPKRLAGIRESLAERLGRVRSSAGTAAHETPTVGEVLDVDAEFRRKAQAGSLPKIAPHRFNPRHEAWLPVLHTVRGERHYTALFSNTARAHGLGATHDWVVLYLDGAREAGQWTVITARWGSLVGRRIVRGREDECAAYYEPVQAAEAMVAPEPASEGSAQPPAAA